VVVGDNTSQAWHAVLDWFAASQPTEVKKLNPPATDADFAQFEAVAGRPLPDELKQIYSINNGSAGGTLFGLAFLSLADVAREWRAWEEIRHEYPDNALGEFCTSFPANAIRKEYSNPGWIPVLYDWGGNYIGVDVDPGPAGRVGQVINFGRDEDDKFVIAQDFTGFLRLMLNQVESGNVEIERTEDGESCNLVGSRHLTDGLRTLLVPAGE
jgi:cell wall assembly regulator SMI1